MSDDLNKKIKQITDMLGQDGIPDNLKGILGSLLGNSGSDSSEGNSDRMPEALQLREDKSARNDMDDSLEMMRKAKKLMDSVRSNNDPRVNLLNAIRPFLNGTRQKRIGSCIKILNMSRMARFMDDGDKGSF